MLIVPRWSRFPNLLSNVLSGKQIQYAREHPHLQIKLSLILGFALNTELITGQWARQHDGTAECSITINSCIYLAARLKCFSLSDSQYQINEWFQYLWREQAKTHIILENYAKKFIYKFASENEKITSPPPMLKTSHNIHIALHDFLGSFKMLLEIGGP